VPDETDAKGKVGDLRYRTTLLNKNNRHYFAFSSKDSKDTCSVLKMQ
jgi:tetrahydromethanopterin S-methyltransferase subunit F